MVAWRWLIGLMLGMACAVALADTVVFPPAENERDGRDAYPVQLLKLALSKSGKAYALKPYPNFMLQDRAIAELRANRELDVIWTMTSAQREEQMLPIRFPIDKGMLGWRLLLIRSADAASFDGITPEDLKKRVAGQGHDWPDTFILQQAGFQVQPTNNYRSLFLMLHNHSIDYFPRSVQEIWGELELQTGKNFTVEPGTVLHYPTAMYFFVNKRNAALADSIRRGLDAAMADGSFEKLFQEYFGAVLRRARLEQRQIIEIANPMLPELTPLGDKRLWLQVKSRAPQRPKAKP